MSNQLLVRGDILLGDFKNSHMTAADVDLLHLVYCTSQFIIIFISLSVMVYCKQHSRINGAPSRLV